MSAAVEVCEPRQLLVVPTITLGMTPAQIDAAWAVADAQATQDVVDAIADLDTTATGMQTQFDSIGSTLTSQQAANDLALQTADAGTFAAMDAQVVVINAAYDAIVGPEDASNTANLQTYADDYETDTEAATDDLATDDVADRAIWNGDLQAAQNTYDTDVASLTATRESTTASEQGILDGALTSASGQYDTDVATADGTLAAANTAADTLLTTTLVPLEATRDANIAALDPVYNSNVAAAASARDTTVLPYPTVIYDATVADGDSNFQTTLEYALSQYYLAVMNAMADYQDDLHTADVDYEDDVTAAQNWFSGEMSINSDTYDNDRQLARDNYYSTLAGPQATRDANFLAIQTTFNNDSQLALDDKETDDALAWSDYADATGIADGLYDGSVTTAADAFSLYEQTRSNTFNGAVQTQTDTYQGVRDGYFTTFDTDINTAHDTYSDDVETAEGFYATAKQGFITTRDGTISTAQSDYASKVTILRDARNVDADLFWDSVATAMAAAMLTNSPMPTINDTPLLTAQQTYEIGVAREAVFLADAIGNAKIQFNTGERGAATTLAQSNATDSEILAISVADAIVDLAYNLADAQEPYQQAIADLTAAYQIDLETKLVDLRKNIAVADNVLAYAYAAAAKQGTIDLSVSAWNYAYDLAPIQETYDKDMATEVYSYTLAESGAYETLRNDLATAEETVINSNAADAETADNMVNAAGADWIRDQYQAYVDYVTAVSGPYITMVTAIANARAIAIINALGGGVDVIIVANAWRDYEIAVGNEEVYRALGVANEWQTFGNQEAVLWQTAEDQKAAARTLHSSDVATAMTVRVSSEAAAEHTYVDNVALADQTYAHDEATKFRTKTEQEADADDDYSQASAFDTEIYDQDVANAVYDYEISFWNRHLTNFTVVTNAERDRIKSEQTELKVVLKEKALHEYNRALTDATDKSAAVNLGAAEDQKAAISLAEKGRADAVRAAYNHRLDVEARALVTFSNAAYARLDAPDGGSMMAQGLNWAWNNLPDLDTSVNFVTGWSDSLTGGASGWVRRSLGIDGGVDYNSGAYHGGQIVGTVHSFMIGGAAGSMAHVGRAYTVARAITTVASVSGGIQAANNIKNGNGTVWDALALAPGAGYIAGRMTGGLGIFRCFVGDTPVVIAEADNVAIAAAGVSESERQAGFEASFMVLAGLTITVGWFGKETLDERQRRGQQKRRRDVARDYDVDDPHRCELLDDSVEPTASSELSPKEFNMLCDDLLSGETNSPDDQSRSGSRETSIRTLTSSARAEYQQRPSRRTSKLGLAWMWACLLIGGGFLWSGLSGTSSPAQPLQASVTRPTTQSQKFVTKPIQDLRVGERVLARNPEVSDSERAEAIEPDPATWRHVSLVMQKPDGSDLRIEMLRPVDWLADQTVSLIDLQTSGWFARDGLLLDEARWEAAIVGRTINLNLPEMGAAGPAKVVAVQPCPQLERNSGDNRQLITATFQHSSGNVLDLHISGESEPIGSTANHPFWSEDRQAFIPAGELIAGETLRRADNTLTQLTRITPRRGPPVAVYNLEVNAEHVYFVGQDGVLVHNSYVHPNSLASAAANHGYAIFDAITAAL